MRIEVYNVGSKLLDCTDEEAKAVSKLLTTYAPGYQFTPMFKQRKWNGKVSLFKGGEILTGLLPVVVEAVPPTKITDLRNITTPELYTTTVPLRDYQFDAVNAAFQNTLYGTWWPRGVIKVATGGGKTEIAAAMIEMAPVTTLFLVHRKELVVQAIKRFAKYGITAGRITEGKLDLNQRVTVATIQSLMSFRHKVNKTKTRTDEQVIELLRKKAERGKIIRHFLMSIEQVFIDEAHLTASTLDRGNLFTQALELMPNAYMRWGLTATPFMREQYHDWLLEGSTGRIVYEKRSQELIEEGYLANPKITMHEVKTKSYDDWAADYEYGIIMNKERNEKILECIRTKPGPIMVLCQRLAHGNTLHWMCSQAGIHVRFLYGEVDLPTRAQALQDLKDGSIKAVIGSTIWDEGLDIAEIRTLILAGGGKSKIKNLQRLGRGLRLSEGKTEVEVVDFFETGSKYLRQHALDRQKLWESEGYDIEFS
jgi:superfamily II DNA or RNA helicase